MICVENFGNTDSDYLKKIKCEYEQYYLSFIKILKVGAPSDVLAFTFNRMEELSRKARVVIEIDSILIEACRVGYVDNKYGYNNPGKANEELVCFLIEKGGNVNSKSKNGTTPIMFAAEQGNLKFTKRLVKYGASLNEVNKSSWDVMDFAKKSKNNELVEYITEMRSLKETALVQNLKDENEELRKKLDELMECLNNVSIDGFPPNKRRKTDLFK